MNNLEHQAKEWKPPATLEELAAEWDRLEQYYMQLGEAAQGAGYDKGSFTGKAIGISICASQLRTALDAVAKEAAPGPAPHFQVTGDPSKWEAQLPAAQPATAPAEPRETLEGLIDVYSAMHNSGAKAIAFPLLLEDLRKLAQQVEREHGTD